MEKVIDLGFPIARKSPFKDVLALKGSLKVNKAVDFSDLRQEFEKFCH